MQQCLIQILLIFTLVMSTNVHATILISTGLEIKFSDEEGIALKTYNSGLYGTKESLSWAIDKNDHFSHSVQTTQPYSIGRAWNPIYRVGIGVAVWPRKEFTYMGNSTTLVMGKFYVRYSADAQHWSTWIPLSSRPSKEPPTSRSVRDRRGKDSRLSPTDTSTKEYRLHVQLRVPGVDRKEYLEYQNRFTELNLTWRGNEEAGVYWILEQDPHFFEKHIPFLGHLQFLYETDAEGAEEIERIEIHVITQYPGYILIPTDKKIQAKYKGPWRYTATPPKKAP